MTVISNPFTKIGTDYLMQKYLERNGYVCNPRQITLDNKVSVVYKNGEPKFDENKTKAVIIPLDFLFKKFLEKDNKIQECIENNKKLVAEDKGHREHFVQGVMWKTKLEKFDKDEIVIPFFWYADGFGINNPLGSKCESIEPSYFSFPTSNNPLADEIILTGVFMKSKDLKSFGNEKCLIIEKCE